MQRSGNLANFAIADTCTPASAGELNAQAILALAKISRQKFFTDGRLL
jgi:hypothetical protein